MHKNMRFVIDAFAKQVGLYSSIRYINRSSANRNIVGSCKNLNIKRHVVNVTPFSYSCLDVFNLQQKCSEKPKINCGLLLNYHAVWKIPCRFAGHSKWQNIKHIKGVKDAEKQRAASRIVNMLKIAIREGGSTDPKANVQLRRVMDRAQELNIPKTTVTNNLKALEKSAKDAKGIFVEARGPLSSLLIVEACTSKIAHVRNCIQSVLKKFGGTIGDKGTAAHSFDFKGLVHVSIPETGAMGLDKAEELAIEVGAEDVSITEGEDEKNILQFVCDSKDMHAVKVGIEENGHEVITARLGYLPTNYVDINLENQEILSVMFDKLDDIDDVVRVYDNFKFTSS